MNKRSDAEQAILDNIIEQLDVIDEAQREQKAKLSILRDISRVLDQDIEEIAERIRVERSKA